MKTMKAKDLIATGSQDDTFDVRFNQSEERVAAMEEAITTGDPNLKPVTVSKNPASNRFVVVDGRHTLSAYYRLDPDSDVPVKVIPWTTLAKMLALAYRANTGGPLPPVSRDTVVTVGRMVNLGCSEGEILALLKGTHSVKYLKTKIEWAKGHEKERKFREADAYRNRQDCTKSQAAVAVGLKPADYEQYLSRGAKNNRSNPIKVAHRKLTAANKSHAQKLVSIFKDIETAFDADMLDQKKIGTFIEDAKAYSTKLKDHCNQRLDRFKNRVKALR